MEMADIGGICPVPDFGRNISLYMEFSKYYRLESWTVKTAGTSVFAMILW